MTQSTGSVFKGSLLVAGTSIGGGMLALPVLTGQGGFAPSLAVFLVCWLFMTATGLLFVELALCMDKNANIVSMAERTLGTAGKAFAWLLYLGLFYCLSVAYIVGCGNITAQFLGGAVSDQVAPFLFVAVFAPFVFAGARLVGKLNVLLMFGLIISFLAFIALGWRYVDSSLLMYRDWSKALLALPIAFISFAYQGIVPTLVNYLDHDVTKIRKSIFIGSLMTLSTYILWQWLIQGIVPVEGPGGLMEALNNGDNAVLPLKNFINTPTVYMIAQYFAFFALVTSFFGVALGLIDFLADGLSIKKTVSGKFILCALVFIPPLMIAFSHPHVFLQALDYAGGYGSALLLGLLPILMVWRKRYQLHLNSQPLIPGGKAMLILMALFVIFELLFELKLTIGRF